MSKIKWLLSGDKIELCFIFQFYTEIPLRRLWAKAATHYGKWRPQHRLQSKVPISSIAHPSLSVECEIYQCNNRSRNKKARRPKKEGSLPKRLEKEASQWNWDKGRSLQMAQVQRRRPFEGVTVKREVRRETKKGTERLTPTGWWARMKQGKGVKMNDSTSNTEVFFLHFIVTDPFLSLPKISSGISFPKHPNPRSY